jgi:hypothetical protein
VGNDPFGVKRKVVSKILEGFYYSFHLPEPSAVLASPNRHHYWVICPVKLKLLGPLQGTFRHIFSLATVANAIVYLYRP